MKIKILITLLACAITARAGYTPLPSIETPGDSNITLIAGQNAEYQMFSTILTGNRTVTLSTSNAKKGDRFHIVRSGLGLFTLAVGSLKTIPSATGATVDIIYDGTAWQLAGYSLL